MRGEDRGRSGRSRSGLEGMDKGIHGEGLHSGGRGNTSPILENEAFSLVVGDEGDRVNVLTNGTSLKKESHLLGGSTNEFNPLQF